ncbi:MULTISPECIES: MFS transporter [unclassified Glutamicibacter]|uniref:MFS transporter n=1 Tax=unclassified Glutamicibacter TaxID=2627139 RepID=UPI00380CF4C5
MEKINPAALIQDAKFNKFHLGLASLSFLLIVFDGYDVAIYGAITPTLMDEWGIDAVKAGTIGSAGLFGMLIGAFIFGTLADKLGRRRIILLTVGLYSFFTALCGFAQEPLFFTVCRFIAGMGLGGVMPNVIALLSDFSPKKHVATITTFVLTGFAVGGLLAPVLGIFIIPNFGWEWSVWIAAFPLALLPWIAKTTPESFAILEKKGRQTEIAAQVRRILKDSLPSPDHVFIVEERSKNALPISDLFSERRGASTILFWVAFFCHLMLAYGILNWLPKIMMEAGFSLTSSLTFLAFWQIGGIVGTILAGRLADKFGAKSIVISLYAIGVLVIIGVGLSKSVVLTFALVALAGGTITGVQNLVQVYISQFYPPFARATALGSASSIGRLGAMVGPILGGMLLTRSFSSEAIFFSFAIPGIFAALAILLVKNNRGYHVTSASPRGTDLSKPAKESAPSIKVSRD